MTARPRRIAGFVVLALAAMACRPLATIEPEDTESSGAWTICSPGPEAPSPESTAAAVAILQARLRSLGVEGNVAAGDDCIDVQAPAAGDDPAIEAAMLGNGRGSLYAVPVTDPAPYDPGQDVPEAAEPLVGPAGIAGARVEPDSGSIASGPPAGRLELALAPDAVTVVRTWADAHRGEHLAVAVDGLIVTSAPVLEAIANARLGMDVPAGTVPLAAIAAMLDSGPLPAEWEQPERPQG